MAANAICQVESQHDDMIHDSQFDYYAKKLATCSSDRTVKIFDLVGEKYQLSATLTGHEGPVWQLAWSHPKFSSLLASCSYDGKVLIHREASQNAWTRVYEHKFHDSSINSIAWAPYEYGLILACASSDGRISILEYKNDAWHVKQFQNDSLGCNSVSWAPFNALGSLEDGTVVRRLATASCDNQVRIWRSAGSDAPWTEEAKQGSSPHSDWVRDVAWAPNTAMPYNIIASCSEDRSIVIWKQQAGVASAWSTQVVHVFDVPVWRVSWSITGNLLAVSTADNKVTLWKQAANEKWIQVIGANPDA